MAGGIGLGDTTYTKVFVGGLAWETHKETMKKHFEQFGEILEAVVITDKASGRSKGYGFVTFREAEAARRACVDATPVIDGRRANCNLASLGLQRSKPSTPNHGGQYGVYGNGGGGGLTAAAAPFYPCGGGGSSNGGAVHFSQPQPFYHQFSSYTNPHHYSPPTISLQQGSSSPISKMRCDLE
ncbi:unnamed protein product [Arabis nemorensis]|uniref:RRM domain-containing protein n=1 Tax=Arabis nemorensis TaxID=586526 RepID=A0A565CTZ7_9BRAS|nr:unnamed protein product [Arabis nemorensis]